MTAASETGRSRRWGLGVLFALALLTAAPVWWVFALPVLDGSRLSQHAGHTPTLLVHALGGTFMLAAGGAALFVGWTGRMRRWHKPIGYAYLGGGSIGALAGLFMATRLTHPPISVGVATGTLAVVWLAFAAMAFRAARNRRFESHREWMIRSYVVTWTFVGCRMAQAAPVFGHLGEEGITAGIWLYWVVPVLACEVALQWGRGGPLRPASKTPGPPA